MSTKNVYDCIGNKIQKHSLIMYPVRKGSDMWMSLSVVTRLTRDKATGEVSLHAVPHYSPTKNIVIKNVGDVIVIPKDRVKDRYIKRDVSITIDKLSKKELV